VWLLAVGVTGVVLGKLGDTRSLLLVGGGIIVGILAGHVLWGNGKR